jgi:hypothetical protein
VRRDGNAKHYSSRHYPPAKGILRDDFVVWSSIFIFVPIQATQPSFFLYNVERKVKRCHGVEFVYFGATQTLSGCAVRLHTFVSQEAKKAQRGCLGEAQLITERFGRVFIFAPFIVPYPHSHNSALVNWLALACG